MPLSFPPSDAMRLCALGVLAERRQHQQVVAAVRGRLDEAGIPHLANPSHIVPVMVGDPVLCKLVSDALLTRYAIYVQPINYPTVPRGTERLRITPTPLHNPADIDHLVTALSNIWVELDLPRGAGWDVERGRALEDAVLA